MKIYIDGANINQIVKFKKNREIQGFTFNPTLISKLIPKKTSYLDFCEDLSKLTFPYPISLEVIGDSRIDIVRQAKILSKLNSNVEVKIPITLTDGSYTNLIIQDLIDSNVPLNITAIFNIKQVEKIIDIVKDTKTILSIFAGRISDIGSDPLSEISKISKLLKKKKSKCRLLWASTRDIYSLLLAKKAGCDIITMPFDIYNKKKLFKKNWKEYSLLTVKQFYKDAKKSKFEII